MAYITNCNLVLTALSVNSYILLQSCIAIETERTKFPNSNIIILIQIKKPNLIQDVMKRAYFKS